jgi:hypothetical protein
MEVNFENFFIMMRINVDPTIIQPVEVEKSLHFYFVKGEKKKYIEYFNEMIIPIECKNKNPKNHPHHPLKFEKFIEDFDIKKYGSILVTEENNKYYIHDGAHRCAILKFRGITKIEVKFLDKKN